MLLNYYFVESDKSKTKVDPCLVNIKKYKCIVRGHIFFDYQFMKSKHLTFYYQQYIYILEYFVFLTWQSLFQFEKDDWCCLDLKAVRSIHTVNCDPACTN